jgi:hypothetical protein
VSCLSRFLVADDVTRPNDVTESVCE